jgi:hypothetical protein
MQAGGCHAVIVECLIEMGLCCLFRRKGGRAEAGGLGAAVVPRPRGGAAQGVGTI